MNDYKNKLAHDVRFKYNIVLHYLSENKIYEQHMAYKSYETEKKFLNMLNINLINIKLLNLIK
jgi:hypothetical protein